MPKPLGAPNDIAAERDAKIKQMLMNIPCMSKESMEANRQKIMQANGGEAVSAKQSQQLRNERNHADLLSDLKNDVLSKAKKHIADSKFKRSESHMENNCVSPAKIKPA